MKLVKNAGALARQAWSMWALYALVILTGLEVGLPYVAEGQQLLGPEKFAGLVGTVSALATLLRVLPQPSLHASPAADDTDEAGA